MYPHGILKSVLAQCETSPKLSDSTKRIMRRITYNNYLIHFTLKYNSLSHLFAQRNTGGNTPLHGLPQGAFGSI